MAETDPALIGRESCGCITYAKVTTRSDLDRHDEKAITRIIQAGGEVIRTTVGEARAMPHFLESPCPHDPKGWEPEPYVDPATRIRVLGKNSSGAATVYRGHDRLGQVRREQGRSGPWFATPGWFKYRSTEADDGSSERRALVPLGPFRLRKEAVEALSSSRSGGGA